MRVGQNPIKAIETIAPPAPITVVVVSYIPFLTGYYAQNLDVLKLCLGSLCDHTKERFDLLVFDNGSCDEVKQYLLESQEQNRIQYLFLSHRNLGKPRAWNIAFAAAPGEIIAYADSDVCFYPGWLTASLKALKDFPRAGMVTAMPILTPEIYSKRTNRWVRKHRKRLKVERGQVLPWADFWRHARGLGDTETKARAFYEKTPATKLRFKMASYYAGAAHFQFTTNKAALMQVLPIPAERPMGRVRLFDEAIDKAGFLRLCTEKWYVQHLGNQVPEPADLVHELRLSGQPDRRQYSRIWRWALLRRFLQWLNGWSFTRLHRS